MSYLSGREAQMHILRSLHWVKACWKWLECISNLCQMTLVVWNCRAVLAWKSSAQVVTFKQSSSIMSSKFAEPSYVSSSHRSKVSIARMSESNLYIYVLLGRFYRVGSVYTLKCAPLGTCASFMIDLAGLESNSGLGFWISQQKLICSLWVRQQLRLRLIDVTSAQPTHLGVLWSCWSAQIVDPGAALDDLYKPELWLQII